VFSGAANGLLAVTAKNHCKSGAAFLADRSAARSMIDDTVICSSVCLSVRPFVTLCIVAIFVGVEIESCTVVFLHTLLLQCVIYYLAAKHSERLKGESHRQQNTDIKNRLLFETLNK